MRETTTKSFSPPSENHQKRLLCVFSGILCHVVAFTIQVWNLFIKAIKAMNFILTFESFWIFMNLSYFARFARNVESWWCCWVFMFVACFDWQIQFRTLWGRHGFSHIVIQITSWSFILLVVTFSLKPVGGVGYHITKYHYNSKGDEKPQPSPPLLSPTFINPMIMMIAKVNLIL